MNCATLRGDAAMSSLFGHVNAAFTGALADRPVLLRKADGGVLFLDESGELGRGEQAMLLRAIEEKAFYPMGSIASCAATSAHRRHEDAGGRNEKRQQGWRGGGTPRLAAVREAITRRVPALSRRYNR